ncbi:hypothetical protein, partial [Bartonella phoceensis]|uniref:hypothetical protein n=1 Tax=Bartonella phoceensis TaxID=270249 RepID=UPI001ABAAB2C
NGSQLFETHKTVANYFGGSTQYENGQWKAPDFKVNEIGSDGDVTEKSHNNVTDAFSSVSSSFKSLHDEISTMISDSLVKFDGKTNRISIGAE